MKIIGIVSLSALSLLGVGCVASTAETPTTTTLKPTTTTTQNLQATILDSIMTPQQISDFCSKYYDVVLQGKDAGVTQAEINQVLYGYFVNGYGKDDAYGQSIFNELLSRCGSDS